MIPYSVQSSVLQSKPQDPQHDHSEVSSLRRAELQQKFQQASAETKKLLGQFFEAFQNNEDNLEIMTSNLRKLNKVMEDTISPNTAIRKQT